MPGLLFPHSLLELLLPFIQLQELGKHLCYDTTIFKLKSNVHVYVLATQWCQSWTQTLHWAGASTPVLHYMQSSSWRLQEQQTRTYHYAYLEIEHINSFSNCCFEHEWKSSIVINWMAPSMSYVWLWVFLNTLCFIFTVYKMGVIK